MGCPPIETPEDKVYFDGLGAQGERRRGADARQPDPRQSDTRQSGPGNPTPGNNTYALAPNDAPGSAAARAAYRATAIASTVKQALSSVAESIAPDGTVTALPPPDAVRVTFRFFHCDSQQAGTCSLPNGESFREETPQTETVPRVPGTAANALMEFVTVAGAGDNDNGVISPPGVVSTGGPDVVISFPASVDVSPSDGRSPVRRFSCRG